MGSCGYLELPLGTFLGYILTMLSRRVGSHSEPTTLKVSSPRRHVVERVVPDPLLISSENLNHPLPTAAWDGNRLTNPHSYKVPLTKVLMCVCMCIANFQPHLLRLVIEVKLHSLRDSSQLAPGDMTATSRLPTSVTTRSLLAAM